MNCKRLVQHPFKIPRHFQWLRARLFSAFVLSCCGLTFADNGSAAIHSFTNSTSITIRDQTNAVPYPSVITTAGLEGSLLKVKVTLRNLTHTFLTDVNVLLVHPSGATVLLMNRVGGTGPGVFNVILTFDQDAIENLPLSTIPISGNYRPTQRGLGFDGTMAPPAPPAPYGTNLASLAGTHPNGTWGLFVTDEAGADIGAITGGWSLSLTIPDVPPTISAQPQSISAGQCGSAAFSVTASGTAPLRYQWRRDGLDLFAATNAIFSMSNLQLSDAGSYSVVVSNAGGFVVSSNAQLTVNTFTGGSGTIANATVICPGDVDGFYASGSVSFSDPNDPLSGPAVWWSLRPSSSGILWMDTSGSSFNSAIIVYRTNTSGGGWTFVVGATTRAFASSGDQSAFLAVNLTSGVDYRIAVYSESGFGGGFYQFQVQRPQATFGGFSVSGVSNGGVITNGSDVEISIYASGIIGGVAIFRVRDRGQIIFQGAAQDANGFNRSYLWKDPGVGIHTLTFETSSQGNTFSSGSFDFLVVGKELGFDRVDQFSAQPTNSGTALSGTLVVRNNSSASTSSLRVRCLLSSTLLGRGYTPAPPVQEQAFVGFNPVTRSALAPGNVWPVSITRAMNVICPYFVGDTESQAQQWHVYAVLEEDLGGGQWVVIDRAKLFSSEAGVLFPPNEGQNGQDAPLNLNQFTYIESLLIQGPPSFNENSSTSLVARVRLSNSTNVSITPVWSVNAPFTIDAAGRLTAPSLAANSNALVHATYTHSIQAFSTNRLITVINLPDPEILRFQSPQVAGGRFRVTLQGASNKVYEIQASTNLIQWSPLPSIATDAQGRAPLDLPAGGGTNRFFIKAVRMFP